MSDLKSTVDNIKWALDERQNTLETLLADVLRDEVELLPAKLLIMLREEGFEKPNDAVNEYIAEYNEIRKQTIDTSSENSDDIDIATIASSPPSYFLCPITKSLFLDPVRVLESEITYERQALLNYLQRPADSSDMHTNEIIQCKIDLKNFTLLPNRALTQQIRMWQERKRSQNRESVSKLFEDAPQHTISDGNDQSSRSNAEARVSKRILDALSAGKSAAQLATDEEQEDVAKKAAAKEDKKYINREVYKYLLQHAAYVSFIQQSQADGVMSKSTFSWWRWGSKTSVSTEKEGEYNWWHLKLNDIFPIGLIAVNKANMDAWHVYIYSEDVNLVQNFGFELKFCSLDNISGTKTGELNVVYVHNPYGGADFYPINEITDIIFLRSCKCLGNQSTYLGFSELDITSSAVDVEELENGVASTFVMKKETWKGVQRPRPSLDAGLQSTSLSPEFIANVRGLCNVRVKSMVANYSFGFRIDLSDYVAGLPELDISLLSLSPTQHYILSSVSKSLAVLDCEVKVAFHGIESYYEYIQRRILPGLGFPFILGYLQKCSYLKSIDSRSLAPLTESLDCNIMEKEFKSSCSFLECVKEKMCYKKFFLPNKLAEMEFYYQYFDIALVVRDIFDHKLTEDLEPSAELLTTLGKEYCHIIGHTVQTEMQKNYAAANLYMAASKVRIKKQENVKYDVTLKHLLVGDSGVGKSCLLLRFASDSFSPTFISTIGVNLNITFTDLFGVNVRNQIWDTAGQERFRTIITDYFRGAMMFYVIYDITDRKSFDNVGYWMNQIQQHATNNVPVVLIGNKCDVCWSQRRVYFEEGYALAKAYGCLFFETSAKNNSNVTMAFQLSFSWLLLRLEYLLTDPERVEAWTAQDSPAEIVKLRTTSRNVAAKKRFCFLL